MKIITICMFCKRRKLDSGAWADDDNPNRTELVSHGICPDCYKEKYGDE